MVQSLNDKTMLLLEDNDEFLQTAIAMFKIFVKHVYVAKSIDEAKALLETKKVDFIFSDIHLKNENGLDFITEFREHDCTTPIVILSGHKDEKYLFRAMTLSLSGYLLKPINFKDLMEVLENCALKLSHNTHPQIKLKEDFIYHRHLKHVTKGNEVLYLNKKEILFFDMLINHPNKILTREMFESFVWCYEEMSDSALNNFIMRIRRRFGKNFIHTIPNIGYKMILE